MLATRAQICGKWKPTAKNNERSTVVVVVVVVVRSGGLGRSRRGAELLQSLHQRQTPRPRPPACRFSFHPSQQPRKRLAPPNLVPWKSLTYRPPPTKSSQRVSSTARLQISNK